MSFLRPEARATLRRYREVLVGAALGLLGLWWLLGPGRLLTLPAVALIVAGGALLWVGVQRARFRNAGDGPGAVTVTEGQIAYFGPLAGGAVALRQITRITLDHTGAPAHWRLEQADQPPLFIPVNAAGAEALFDAFATLPGLRTERMLSALQDGSAHLIVIWQRDPATATRLPVH